MQQLAIGAEGSAVFGARLELLQKQLAALDVKESALCCSNSRAAFDDSGTTMTIDVNSDPKPPISAIWL